MFIATPRNEEIQQTSHESNLESPQNVFGSPAHEGERQTYGCGNQPAVTTAYAIHRQQSDCQMNDDCHHTKDLVIRVPKSLKDKDVNKCWHDGKMTVVARDEGVKRELSPIGKEHPFVERESVSCSEGVQIATNNDSHKTDAECQQPARLLCGRLLLVHTHNVRHQRFITETCIPLRS